MEVRMREAVERGERRALGVGRERQQRELAPMVDSEQLFGWDA